MLSLSDGVRGLATDLDQRLVDLQGRLDHGLYGDYESLILRRALNDLLSPTETTTPTFWLRPHVLEEIQRLPDHQLGKYLFHRYRYDIFPQTKELDDYPPCVQVEPTSICNFRCVFCFQTDPLLTKPKEGHQGQMPLRVFTETIDQLENNVEFLTLASRGEPLLAKEIDTMLSYLSGKFLGLKINTNASFLTESKSHALLAADPNTVVFSADAADEDTYEQLRINGNFKKVMKNIEQFMRIKEESYPDSKVITRVSGVAFDRDKQDHKKIEAFWHNYVDQVAFVDYNPWENTYDKENNNIEEACSDLWRRTFVWWDGRVNPCDVDYRSFLSPGSVQENVISSIWNGQGYEHLRQQHLARERRNLVPCRGCVTV